MSTDRRTNMATCFKRGALAHSAKANLFCVRDQIRRGGNFPVELAVVGVAEPLRTIQRYVPKELVHQAELTRKQLLNVVKLAQKGGREGGFDEKRVLKALGTVNTSLNKLNSKLQGKCKA